MWQVGRAIGETIGVQKRERIYQYGSSSHGYQKSENRMTGCIVSVPCEGNSKRMVRGEGWRLCSSARGLVDDIKATSRPKVKSKKKTIPSKRIQKVPNHASRTAKELASQKQWRQTLSRELFKLSAKRNGLPVCGLQQIAMRHPGYGMENRFRDQPKGLSRWRCDVEGIAGAPVERAKNE